MRWLLKNHESDEVGIIEVLGFDKHSIGGQLRYAVKEHLTNGKAIILLNLRKMKHIDALGLGELVDCYRIAQDNSKILVLVRVHRNLNKVLTTTKLNLVFKVFRDEDEAIKSLKG